MDSLKLGDNGVKLVTSAIRQAEQVVVTAQGILESDNSLMPMPDKAAAWQGVIPLSWAVLNVPDSLRFEMARLPFEGLVRTLTSGVTPALVFLNKQSSDVRITKLVSDWISLTGNVQKYDKLDAASTPMLLRRFPGHGKCRCMKCHCVWPPRQRQTPSEESPDAFLFTTPTVPGGARSALWQRWR